MSTVVVELQDSTGKTEERNKAPKKDRNKDRKTEKA
jgi:hypothetical protein